MAVALLIVGGLILFGMLMANGKHNPEYNAKKEKEHDFDL